MKLSTQRKIYTIYILLIIVSIFGYGIQKLCSFSLFPDEFGYWASAAKMAGYDWQDVVSLGSYYSFGYGILLFPVLKLTTDGIMAYRAAVFLNMLLMCFSIPLMHGILRSLFQEKDEVQQIFFCGIAVLYPSWIFYMQMTMAEAVLMFLNILIFRIFLALINRLTIPRAIGLAIVLIYTYCVHMRTLGIVIACMITVFLRFRKSKKENDREVSKAMLTFWLAIVVTAFLTCIIKKYVITEIFNQVDTAVLATNDYIGFCEKIKGIISLKGIFHLITGIVGKIFYLGLASFGLFFWAMTWCISNIKKSPSAVFLMLAVTGEIIISSVYMVKDSNIDSLVYGRYNDFLVPALILIGICTLTESCHPFRFVMMWGMAEGIAALGLYALVEKEERTGIRGYMAVGISYFIKEDAFDAGYYFFFTFLMGFLLTLLFTFLIWFGCRKENRAWIMGGVMLVEIILGLHASHHYTYRYNEIHFVDKIIAETIQERIEESNTVMYLKEDKTNYIDAVQMWLGEQPVRVLSEEIFFEDGIVQGDFLIAVRWTKYREQLDEIYNNYVETNTFLLYYDIKE